MKKQLTDKEFAKLEDKTIKQVLKWTNYLMESGIKSNTWTLTNSFKVTFRDLKRKARGKK